ncbi:coiled-coil domain-containing protein 93 isoform X5 [Pleuronectes platessa]|uniref:coiled-coil domain-containing protein 93 isoform X5 n=1 Tax=Pleuronectes platessa TaxID=8262 RepID=UPI00232A675B|nr:coiled-coil domain-containing protein 93 isoform X5 [Pleuronectes platessa]
MATMMATASSVFLRVRTGSKIGAQYDQEGNLIQVETREDEEQSFKLSEILELLLAAGYFRARIKGLSPFDKVVGGMTWCITTCNFDIDVDLLFQENLTIGLKIALTEKIVSVLPKMKCPHHLEPHQIQGLDFIHIFPVIQDEEFLQQKDKAVKTVLDVLEMYKPQRKYRRQKDAGQLLDEESRVHSTLLEYGRRYGFRKQSKQEKVDEGKALLASGSQVTPPGMIEVSEEDDLQAAEEMRIKTLMTSMAAMVNEEGKLTASAVGQIVGLQSEEIKQIASEYAEKQSELISEERSELYGPLQQHHRAVASLTKQIQQKTKQLEELKASHAEVKTGCDEVKRKLMEATQLLESLEKEVKSLEELEEQADSGLLQKLRALVTMNENLKQQEQDFRTHCREEMGRLQQNIEELKMASGQDTEEKERNQLIDKQYNADRDKLQKIRLVMARRNREIAILQRQIDEVPSRAELTQYQKRFIELYSQVSATHKETKQFFTLYNTLDDKKIYLEKEVNLLNSIHDNFQQAMSSSAAKEQFLRQMEQIVEGIKQSRIKMEKKKQGNKMRRDRLNDEYLELLDKQRLYFKTVKDFKEECRKNEMLLSKMRAKGAS